MTPLFTPTFASMSSGSGRAWSDATKAGSVTELRTVIERQEDEINKLYLVTQAMWELLRDRTQFEEKDLLDKVEEIDLRDGIKDGKVAKTVVEECQNCGRKMSKSAPGVCTVVG